MTSTSIRQFLVDLMTALGPDLRAASRDVGTIDTKTSFHDVVTKHDRATEIKIKEAVFAAFPDSLVLGEEGGWSSASGEAGDPSPEDLVWIVDPIDGTSNFASGWDHWCISIAATRNGEHVASSISQPLNGRIWSADEEGSYLDEPDQPTRVLKVDENAVPSDGLCATEFPKISSSPNPEDFERWREAGVQFRSMRRTGSTALDLCYVADGRAVASFSHGVNAWDVAAGIHIIRQAGGFYEGYTDGQLTTPSWEGGTFVAGPSEVCIATGRKALGL